jgi:hypothetical protein
MFCFYMFQGDPISNDIFSVFFPALPVQFHAILNAHTMPEICRCMCLAGRQTSDSKITLMVEEIRATLLSYSL